MHDKLDHSLSETTSMFYVGEKLILEITDSPYSFYENDRISIRGLDFTICKVKIYPETLTEEYHILPMSVYAADTPADSCQMCKGTGKRIIPNTKDDIVTTAEEAK